MKPQKAQHQRLRSALLGPVFMGAIASVGAIALISSGFRQAQIDQVGSSTASANVKVVAYRSPTCGCCEGWVTHIKNYGFEVEDKVGEDLIAIKQQHGVPPEIASCHTAMIDGYVVEGHIPAADIQKLLVEKPNIKGIAVPGMPLGSPGMEAGSTKEPYTVFSFDGQGQIQPFVEHHS